MYDVVGKWYIISFLSIHAKRKKKQMICGKHKPIYTNCTITKERKTYRKEGQ